MRLSVVFAAALVLAAAPCYGDSESGSTPQSTSLTTPETMTSSDTLETTLPVLKMMIILPLSMADFTEAVQDGVCGAVSAAAGMDPSNVRILSVMEVAAGSVVLEIAIEMSSGQLNRGAMTFQTTDNLNRELAARSLPQAKILEPPRMCTLEACTCPLGFLSERGSCAPCPVNTYYKNSTSGEGTCTTCPPNSYTSEQASTLCTCLQGFTPRYNSSLHHPGGACVACISGFYKPKPGDDLCTACPPGSYASPPAASNVSQCAVCPPGMLQLVGHGSGNSGIHT
jgi:hypothetical protein